MSSVFISHSSADRELTDQVWRALEAPTAAGVATPRSVVDYDVLLDYETLVKGKPWPRQLHEWMARCNAGLLLLTKNAAISAWVLNEATILSWRLALDENFSFFVVQFPDVTDTLLREQKFSPLDLGRIQRIPTTSPAEIAQFVQDTLGPRAPPPTLFDRIVNALAGHLDAVKDAQLREIAEAVRIEPPAWKPGSDARVQYLEEIARRLLAESLGSYKGVNKFVDALQATPLTTEALNQVLSIVAPYWVNGTVAGVLPPLATRRGVAGMNGRVVPKYTARMYVSRAYPLSRAYEYVPIIVSAGDYVAHVKREICKEICRRHNENLTDDEVVSAIAERDEPVYVALPPPIPSKAQLNELRKTFPTVTFILSTGETLDPPPDLSEVSWLEPAVDIEVEKAQSDAFFAAERIIRRKQQGL
jgi:hypothetical protein